MFFDTIPNDLPSLDETVWGIKQLIEQSIIDGGEEGKNFLIRSQKPICMLHDAAKASFIQKGVSPMCINPPYGEHVGELRLSGFFKCKDQDICFLPKNTRKVPEILEFEGILHGTKDKYGFNLTEHTLSVNVRSQLSSIAKNFDTLYERTFAEALNLHLRCPNMVLGEFYMIPVYEYDDKLVKQHRIGFKDNAKVASHIEKYIRSFSAVNNRTSVDSEDYKYERVCLLIVDFSQTYPKIYNTTEELLSDGLLSPKSTATIDNMNFPTFADTLLSIYKERFGSIQNFN